MKVKLLLIVSLYVLQICQAQVSNTLSASDKVYIEVSQTVDDFISQKDRVLEKAITFLVKT